MIRRGDERWLTDGDETRRRMIAETSAFLSWALRQDGDLPRIPRRRVDRGGFSYLRRCAESRDAVSRWWQFVLSRTLG